MPSMKNGRYEAKIMIKVIKNESEYLEALKQIEDLIDLDPQAGTVESHKLELLGLLIQDYESTRYFQTQESDPVDAIIFRMEQQNLKQRDLIQYIGSRSKVSEILSRKRPLSTNMIRALNKGLGIPLKSLFADPKPESNTFDVEWKRFPISEMRKRQWIEFEDTESEKGIKNVVMNFMSQIGINRQPIALHRKTDHIRSARQLDKYALTAWTARIISLAEALGITKSYHSSNLNSDFMNELLRLSMKESAPALVQEFFKEIGIAFVIEPQLPRTHIDGVALIHEELSIIGMTIRYDRIDNFWFTLIHELAHIHLHLNDNEISFYDDLDLDNPTDEFEKEADNFASELLIPEEEWKNSVASKLRIPEAAQHLAERLNIHPAIVAGRMRYKFKNYKILNNLVGHNEVRKCFPEIQWR